MSIMHYRDNFGPDRNKPTMVAKKSKPGCDLRTSPIELAESDIQLLNKMYKCEAKPTPVDECSGIEGERSCCSKEEPCKEGGGDCDDDEDCSGSLVCGRNNCQDFNPLATTSADCCKKNKCSGMSDERSCCSKEEPCKGGGGDCDDDADCSGSLVCGRNNCQEFNPLATTSADCCMNK